MDVVCDRCKAEYEFDDALVSERGTTVKCTNCGHQFKIYRPASHPDAGRGWNLRRPDGTQIPFDSLAVLQKWILEGRVSKVDEISRANEPWKSLGAIAELESFFHAAETRSSTPTPSVRPPPSPLRAPTPRPPPSSGNAPALPPRTPSHRPGPPSPPTRGDRDNPHEPSRTALVGTPSPPSRPPVDASRAAVSTVDGYALGVPPPPPLPDVAIGPPTSRVSAQHSLEPPPPPPPTSRTLEPAAADRDDDEFPVPAQPKGRGLVMGVAMGFVMVLAVGAAAWQLGYLHPPVTTAPGAGGVSPAAEAHVVAARRLVHRGTVRALEDAREEATRALALAPDHAAAHATRAHVMALWGELLRQRAEDLEARAAQPGADAATLRAEAVVLRRDSADRLDRARADQQRADGAVSSLRGEARAVVEAELADVARVTGDSASANRHLDAARAAGASPDSDVVAALVARDTGLDAQAAEGLQAAVARVGDRAVVRIALARLLAKRGDATGARRELDAVLQAYPDHDDAQRLAQALERGEAPMRGPVAVALASADAAAAPEPTVDAAVVAQAPREDHTHGEPSHAEGTSGRSYDQLINDGERLQDEGRSSQARERFRAALALRPGGCEALAGMGFVDLEDRELSSAVSYFRRALDASPRYSEAWVGLGEAYTSMGRYEQALDAYNHYLQVSPGGEHAHMARRQIESLQERLHPQGGASGVGAATPPATPGS